MRVIDFGGRPHGAGDEARLRGGGELVGSLARDLGGEEVQLVGAVLEVESARAMGVPAEGVGFDHVGAGFEVGAVDVRNDLGAHTEDVFAAVLVLGAAEVGHGDALVQHGAHGPIEDEDTFGEDLFRAPADAPGDCS